LDSGFLILALEREADDEVELRKMLSSFGTKSREASTTKDDAAQMTRKKRADTQRHTVKQLYIFGPVVSKQCDTKKVELFAREKN
jgi:hypothetical protein